MFLDEPTLGLDVISQSRIRDFIKHYNEEYQTTFVITSHYIKDIQELCKRVYVIHKGSGLYDGNFHDLIKKINPKSKLIFEFSNKPNDQELMKIKDQYNVNIDNKQLTGELVDTDIKALLIDLLQLDSSKNFKIDELPVEEAMKSFFLNPEEFLNDE